MLQLRVNLNSARVTIRKRHSVTAAQSVAACLYGRPAYRCSSVPRAVKGSTRAAQKTT